MGRRLHVACSLTSSIVCSRSYALRIALRPPDPAAAALSRPSVPSARVDVAASNGVVIASEKKVPSPLVDATTVEKTAMLTANVGITYSGMGPDFRVLVNKGRKAGQKYWLEYHDPIPVALLARELATVMQVRRAMDNSGGSSRSSCFVDTPEAIQLVADFHRHCLSPSVPPRVVGVHAERRCATVRCVAAGGRI